MPGVKYLCPGLSMPWFCVSLSFSAYSAAMKARRGGLDRGSNGNQHNHPDKIPSERVSMMHEVFVKLETVPTAARGCKFALKHAG